MRKSFHIVCYLLFSLGMISAQQTDYTRKSITFLDAIILANPTARDMSIRQIDYTRSVTKRAVQLERFDYNPIPQGSGLMSKFTRKVDNQSTLSMEAIAQTLNTTFVAEIVAIIDENAEKRASELVDEAARMSFVATKAKDLGISAANLEAVFNSGYIYLPFINGFSESLEAKKDDKEKKVVSYNASTTISGGILWFKIDYTNGRAEVRPLLQKETSSTGYSSKHNAKEAEWNAFQAAADNYAANLEVATKDIEDFKLKTQVLEVNGANIGFNMGRKEGLHVDDRYILGETIQDAHGELTFKKDGFARVKSIGDNIANPGAMSYAYGVIVGDWAPGMSLIEYPTLDLDLYFMAGQIPLSTDETFYTLESAVAIGGEITYNLSRIIQKSHWYLTAGGALGSAELTDSYDNYLGGTASVNFAIMRRIQMRRFDAYAKGGLAYYVTTISEEVSDDLTKTYQNEAVGAVLGGGLNLTLSIDLALGLRYSYYMGSSDEWTVTDDNDNTYDDWFMNTSYTGGSIMLQVIYTPKALGFNPIALLGNLPD